MKKIGLGVLIAAVLSGGGYVYMTNEAVAKSSDSKHGRQAFDVPVVTDKVKTESVTQSLSLIGKLVAQDSIVLSAEVTAPVTAVIVSDNAQVKKGAVLFQFDNDKARAEYDEAQAYWKDENRKAVEFQRLVKRGAVTQAELDAQLTNVAIAQARLNAKKAVFDDHTLRAPFAGTVGLVNVSEGQRVEAGSDLLTLDDLSAMQVDVAVPERYLSVLQVGSSVSAMSQAWPDRAFSGEIVAIDSRVQTDTLNIKVRVRFNNSDRLLKSGMLMAVDMTFPAQQSTVIPVQSLEYSGTKRFVYRVNEDNKAVRTEVQLGTRIDNRVVINDGLELGDRIVVKGLVNMRDGVAVQESAAAQITSHIDAPPKGAV